MVFRQLSRASSALKTFVRHQRQALQRRNTSVIDRRMVFLIASPRSGTTWLQTALNAHPQIACGESRLFGPHFDVMESARGIKLRVTMDQYVRTQSERAAPLGLPVSNRRYQQELLAGFASTMFELWQKHTGKPVVVDKVTPYTGTSDNVVSSLQHAFPSASYIQLIRDGRDVATSGVFHWLNKCLVGQQKQPAVRRQRIDMASGGRGMTRFFEDAELEEWARTWSEPIRAVRQAQLNSCLTVSYESMLRDQRSVLHRICEHAGTDTNVAWLDHCVRDSSFVRMSGGRQPGEMNPIAHVRNGVSGNWRGYFTRRDGALFDSICGDLLTDLGYEPDRRWWTSLPETLMQEKLAG